MSKILKLIPILLAFVLIASACNHSDSADNINSSTSRVAPSVTNGSGGIVRVSLRTVSDCDILLNHFKTEALKIVGPYGLGGGFFVSPLARGGAELFNDAAVAVPTLAAADSPSFSTTNVQVKGVDEPDIVKTDGNRIIGISSGELWIADVTSSPAEKTGSLILGTDYDNIEILLHEDKVLAFLTTYSNLGYATARLNTDISTLPTYNNGQTHVIEIDISSSVPEILNELIIEGRYLSARQVGNTVNLVVQSQKSEDLGFVYPSTSSSTDRAERINRQIIEESLITDWIPIYNLVNEQEETLQSGTISPCNKIHIPSDFSGLDLLSIITIDLNSALPAQGTASIIADGDTIYSSGETLYVAHRVYNSVVPVAEGDETGNSIQLTQRNEVWFHKFATPENEQANYLASGSVQGNFLSQFSFHETPDEHFWIVTTDTNFQSSGAPTPPTDDSVTFSTDDAVAERFIPPTTESFVNSFRQDGSSLTMVGRVGGLGKNERVQSVRFIGTKAYVVTFRRIDPFYVVDLSAPENPVVAGELKIPGFSSYLHPLGNDRLLGVGSSADENGRVTGAKLSLFDASDPTNPLESKILELGSGYTDVTWDHRAFLYWDPADRLVMPFNSYRTDFFGAIVVNLNPDSSPARLSEVGRFQHAQLTEDDCEKIEPVPFPTEEDGEAEEDGALTKSLPSICRFIEREFVDRNIVIGDTLWSVSSNHLESRDISDLAKIGSLRVSDSLSVRLNDGNFLID